MTNTSETLNNIGRRRALLIFATASLAAVLSGSATLAASGVSFGFWSRNPIAWLIGLVLAMSLMRLRSSLALSRVILVLALVAVAGTFVAPAQHGVHRWIDVGPLHVNVAALFLSSAIVALAFCGIWSRTGLAFVAAMAALLVLQPDASQATSFLVAVIILMACSPATRARRVSAIAAAVVLVAVSWMRPDPLQPVAEVEGIFRLAFGVSPVLAAAAALALTATSVAPLGIRSAARAAQLALTGYFICAAIFPALGAFPVPLVGLGMSFPVGYWLGIALLCEGRSDPRHSA
jgi:cell division protein FtsW (lipid II flippase)